MSDIDPPGGPIRGPESWFAGDDEDGSDLTLPHWTEPGTGQVDASEGGGPRWRDGASDYNELDDIRLLDPTPPPEVVDPVEAAGDVFFGLDADPAPPGTASSPVPPRHHRLSLLQGHLRLRRPAGGLSELGPPIRPRLPPARRNQLQRSLQTAILPRRPLPGWAWQCSRLVLCTSARFQDSLWRPPSWASRPLNFITPCGLSGTTPRRCSGSRPPLG